MQGAHMEKSIDKDVLADYNAGAEKDRLRTGMGRVEFARTKKLLFEFLPPADTQSRAYTRKGGEPYGPQHAPAGGGGEVAEEEVVR
jgi:hypothetical protein